MPVNPDLAADLRKRFSGEIRLDAASRILYSTDASIYQIEPAGVLLPRTADDIQVAVELAAKYRVPIVPRGSGTSLAGQAIGDGLILDCSRWLRKILAIDPERCEARVQPGVILSNLNAEAARFGLQFGPDPASAERATMGGVIGNNGTGAHSVVYGMAADHLVSAVVVLADGSMTSLGPAGAGKSENDAHSSRAHALQAAAHQIRNHSRDLIVEHFPRTWRNSAGYRLNYLLPWAPGMPTAWSDGPYPRVPDRENFNLAHLLAGSEGTLAVIQELTVKLVPRPTQTVLALLTYDDEADACDAVPDLLQLRPSAIELVPRLILNAARRVPDYARSMRWLSGDPAAILIVEFSADEAGEAASAASRLGERASIISSPEQQAMVWSTRKAGLGLLDSAPVSRRPISFIEDCAIPVEHLGVFVRELRQLMLENGALGGIYGHASAGCLHIRPVLDLKTGEGVKALRQVAEQTLAIALRLGGAMSSEHGDGLARGEWLRRTYGDELTNAMLELKRAADPDGILNPGKMFDAAPMDTQLRYGPSYHGQGWASSLDFARRGGIAMAIEQCNGQGVCRKDVGVMCPSFQGTREEMHSTRGRANLLRALISAGNNPSIQGLVSETGRGGQTPGLERSVHQALDLCLACKGCTAECPSGVDMPRLKSAFLERYYKHRPRPLRDYLFGYLGTTASALSIGRPLIKVAMAVPGLSRFAMRSLGIATERPLPDFGRRRPREPKAGIGPSVFLARDPFTHYVDTVAEDAAVALLESVGFVVKIIDVGGAGAAQLSKGFIGAARRQAQTLIARLVQLDPDAKIPIAFIEPSELSIVRDEYRDLLPAVSARDESRIANACSVEDLLVASGKLTSRKQGGLERVLFHPHCHERADARSGTAAERYSGLTLLRECGYQVQLIEAGCCGMGGTFGYEAEHYPLSQAIGNLKLFPAIESTTDARIAATGASCRLQIEQGTGRSAEHPLVLAARALDLV